MAFPITHTLLYKFRANPSLKGQFLYLCHIEYRRNTTLINMFVAAGVGSLFYLFAFRMLH
jgi:hypothetical protein